ncbi:bifunctional 2-keto-4-hydroxyglutarate aldolase/2-keto-3-deoxy-6-phosphogluconate aldolase, partial [Streptococcus equi subsp. zooepidemicus]|nr:bifunctional 2-keto-4-hydroxyglutarate aldolase/2-keto-3-deoxy-6-phosphogluconate aldolase [Streptococcus equi subsp. zooepidemicus]
KAIKSPLPQVDVMVTGGVTVTNVSDWFAAGAQVLGVGGEFNQLAAQGQFQAITARAADYMSSC